MANKYLHQLGPLGAAPASGDLFHITDVDDATDLAAGTSKKLTFANLQAGISITESQISDLGSYVALTALSVGAEGTASGDGSLAYNSGTGVFTYTPPTAAGIGAATTSHAHAASDVTSGTLAHERGGLEADVSAYSGLIKITAGATSAITDNSTNWNTAYGWGDHSTQGYLTGITGESVGSLSDVTLTSTAANDILSWNGSAFVNTDAPTLDSLQFDTAAAESVAVGKLSWNADEETLNLGLDADVTLQIGQESVMRVKATEAIRNGMAVYAAGQSGGSDNIEVAKFIADDNGIDELYFLGLATETFSLNETGFVTTFGRVRGLDGRTHTAGGIRDDADAASWSVGDLLYISPNIAGCLTSVAPTAPYREMAVAWVLHIPNDTNITIFVRADHGYHLDDIHDVDIDESNIADNEVLSYDSASGTWINQSLAELGAASGTVTSVAATVPTGFTISGSPITTTGTLAIAFDTGYALPLSSKQTNWDTAYGWGDHSTQGYLTGITGEALSSLSDVTITSIASGEILKWNGAAWINNTLAEAIDHGSIGGLTDDDHTQYLLVDGSRSMTGSLNLAASTNLSFNSVNILADSAGTMTLSNIDALDATTEATIEAAIDTLPNLTTAATLSILKAQVSDFGTYVANPVTAQIDMNGQAIGDGTRELLTFTEDASAVNHINIENQATGGGPIIRSAGDDTNIPLVFETAGSGDFYFETLIYSETNNKISYADIADAGTGTALTISSAGVDAANVSGATGGSMTLKSGDAADSTGGATGSLILTSGTSTSGASGATTIGTGGADGANSGSITLQTGTVSTSGEAGDIILAAGADVVGGTYGAVRPDGDGVQDFGSLANRWQAVYQTTNYFVETGAGTNYVAFTAPASITSNITWILPDVDGAAGQTLTTDGAGTLYWDDDSQGAGGGIALTDLSVGAEGAASGDGALSYDNGTGVFTYTPPGAASTTASGLVEIATGAETTTGTDATRAVSPDGLAASDFGKTVVSVLITDPNGDALATGDGKAYWRVPETLNGYNLVGVAANVTTASSGGTPEIQIHNVTAAADMLTTTLTIDATETDSNTATAAAVIDAANDDVQNDGATTPDVLRFDVDTAGTGTKGLSVELTFQLP